jgi:hypothetical protein
VGLILHEPKRPLASGCIRNTRADQGCCQGLPVHIAPDRCEHVLRNIPASHVSLRRRPSGNADLPPLAQAKRFTRSNHTLSPRVACQVERPSILPEAEQIPEQPSAGVTPNLKTADDVHQITCEAVAAS